jgi:SAM-dependent methyltransferase
MALPWHEQDEFWKTWAPVIFSERRLEAAREEVPRVVALLGLEPGAKILDLCCGPGRHSLELARRGYRVTGVDRTALYLEKARETAAAENLDVEFVQKDAREFSRSEAFDGAINLFTSFGYFEDPADDFRVMRNLCASLRPCGKLAMDLMGKEVLARVFQERNWHEVDNRLVLEERKICRHWTWIENRWIQFADGRRFEHEFSHRLYSAAELERLAREAGFESVEVFGDLEGAPYDEKAKRLLIVAGKGGAPGDSR